MRLLLRSSIRQMLLVLLVAQALFVSGCTSVLWQKETFACHYQPAHPVNLRLFYSKEHKEVLVEYDEARDTDKKIRTRFYWLGPNISRVNRELKPQFVSSKERVGLLEIAVAESSRTPARPSLMELRAVARREDEFFTLYTGNEQLEAYKYPTYVGGFRRVKQVLLTPFAIAIDATIIGGVIGYYSAPQILGSLNR
jgi:hypothetical protein